MLIYLVPIALGLFILKMTSHIAKEAPALAKVPSLVKANPRPLPTYFLSHGGPTFIYKDDDFGNLGAWNTIKEIGNKIKYEWKPDYVVVVSAHWQLSGSSLIEIAVPPNSNGKDLQENPLIYDFYGFPKHMYQEELHTMNSRFVSEQIRDELKKGGFHADLTPRGIDHGVWVSLKVAFSEYNTQEPPVGAKPDLDLPDTALIQVSLTGVETDFDTHFKLGKVLSKFRENLIWDPAQGRYLQGMVICSGMTVHNLREIGLAMSSGKRSLHFAGAFNGLLRETMVNDDKLLENLNKLKTEHRPLLYRAHPTLEHFVPIVVAGGVVNHNKQDPIKEVYSDETFSLGWGIYQFGEY